MLRPIAFMEDEVAYQMACDQGFDVEQRLQEEIEALRREEEEIEGTLKPAAQKGAEDLSEIYSCLHAYAKNPVAENQTGSLTQTVVGLRGTKVEASDILDKATRHMNRVAEANKAARERIVQLQRTLEKKSREDPFCSFIEGVGTRAGQYLIHGPSSSQDYGRQENASMTIHRQQGRRRF